MHFIDKTDTLLYVTKNRLFLLYTDLRWPSFAAAVATFLWACEFSLLFWRLYPFNSLSAFYEKTIPDKIKFKNGWLVNSPNLTVSHFFFSFIHLTDQLTNIRRHRFKISNVAKFESNMLKDDVDMAPHFGKILQMSVRWGRVSFPHPHPHPQLTCRRLLSPKKKKNGARDHPYHIDVYKIPQFCRAISSLVFGISF